MFEHSGHQCLSAFTAFPTAGMIVADTYVPLSPMPFGIRRILPTTGLRPLDPRYAPGPRPKFPRNRSICNLKSAICNQAKRGAFRRSPRSRPMAKTFLFTSGQVVTNAFRRSPRSRPVDTTEVVKAFTLSPMPFGVHRVPDAVRRATAEGASGSHQCLSAFTAFPTQLSSG